MKSLLRVLHCFRPDALRLVPTGAWLVLGSLAGWLKPWPLAWIVDCVLGGRPLPAGLAPWLGTAHGAALLPALAGLTLALHLGQAWCLAAGNFRSIDVGLRGLGRVRNAVFARLTGFSPRQTQAAQIGDLLYRANWDTYAFQTIFQQGLVTAATAGLGLVVMVGLMWHLDGSLTLAALGTVWLVPLGIRFFGPRMQAAGGRAQAADSRLTATLQQTLAGLRVLQSYTREERLQAGFQEETREAHRRRRTQHGWELIYGLAVSTALAVGTTALIWLGARRVLAGALTVGELLVFLAYLAQLYEPLQLLSHVGATVAAAGAGVRRVGEVLDTPVEPAERGGGLPAGTVVRARGEVVFEGVSFGYTPDRLVLEDLTLAVAAGQTVAIIGPSGSGKSTLLHLLPRFLEPAAGMVRLDGRDLRDWRVRDLRTQVAWVPQEPHLLPGTIAENIALGRPDAPLEAIREAARAANADEFISRLPAGYATVVGEGAARLSVGEQQRLGLARALLKDAPVLLLDEPTSALDAASEALVLAGLARLCAGRTTFLVAHRAATLRLAHRVFELRAGRLVECAAPPPAG